MIPRSLLAPVRTYWRRRLDLIDSELDYHEKRVLQLRHEACAVQERLDALNGYGRPPVAPTVLAIPESRWRR